MEIRVKYAETLFLFLGGIISIVFLVVSRGYSDIARAVPNICAVFVLLCSGFRLAQIWWKNSLRSSVLKVQKRLLPFILILAGYTAGVFLIGFMLASAIFIPICMYWMGQRKIALVSFITAGYLLIVYLVFVTGFRMPLPDSIVGF